MERPPEASTVNAAIARLAARAGIALKPIQEMLRKSVLGKYERR
jgi:hypothetical protein